jgi:hypothetical protein
MSRTSVALDLRHASLQMGGPDSFGTPPSYHKTLSGDLGLIHKTHRGFTYRYFATGEDEGSCPWVSRVPKRRNLFMLNRFGVSHIGISRLANTRELALGFPGCRNAETPKLIHAKPIRGFAYRDFATGEYEGTCPWVSRVSKRQNLFMLSRFEVSHIGISRLANTRELALGFLGC